MKLQLVASASNPPIAALCVIHFGKKAEEIPLEWSENLTALNVDGKSMFSTSLSVSQYLVRMLVPELGSESNLCRSEINHWCTFANVKLTDSAIEDDLKQLNEALAARTFLVGNSVSLADIYVFSHVYKNRLTDRMSKNSPLYANILRWYNFISEQSFVKESFAKIPDSVKEKIKNARGESKQAPPTLKDEGKFIDLEGAEMNKVVVRFPPEASGYLHIGHAKAALLNQHYRDAFKGKLILRFDDTNPEKEKATYEKAIMEDLKLLKIHPDVTSRTSDHFGLMLECCDRLIREGKAYVDDTVPEKMKTERENREESVNRNNTTEKNIQMWSEMVEGSEFGQRCCARAKIDMKSDNGCMRDPAIYRCKDEPHCQTGTKYKVYPTYDFACPIVDSIEGVTHALRTTEYHDRDDQFFWFIDALGLRKPYIWEYSRLNMMNTVLSKRRLRWIVNENIVDGWDDPRFPTVRAVIRRGMTVEGLKQFILAQGSSRSVVVMDWGKIWAFNKKVIDPVANRYIAVDKQRVVPVVVSGVKEDKHSAQLHPKDLSIGMKSVWTGQEILIEGVDADSLKENENATFINWGNLKIIKLKRNSSGQVELVEAEPNLENKDYKKTPKVTWLAKNSPLIPCICVYFDHIIAKSVLSKDDDFKDYINKNSKSEVLMIGDPELIHVKKSEIIQLQRKGFFICDQPYESASRYSGKESPIVLFSVPDGSTGSGKPPQSSGACNNEISGKQKGSALTPASSFDNKQLATVDIGKLNKQIEDQGNKVRQLKSSKATESELKPEITKLLNSKAGFKSAFGKDWKSGGISTLVPSGPNGTSDIIELNKLIIEQGKKVRTIKADKAEKMIIDKEVQILLSLKSQYKQALGQDWEPGIEIKSSSAVNVEDLDARIRAQGDKIRAAKSNELEKSVIDEEVQVLLALKNDYKAATGSEWKPKAASGQRRLPTPATNSNKQASEDPEVTNLKNLIDSQGQFVRNLKSSGAPKEQVDAEVQKLLTLKSEYKAKTEEDMSGSSSTKKGKKEKKQTSERKIEHQESTSQSSAAKKITRLGLEATKEDNLPEWYSQTITKSEMIEYYDVSGCYILRPWSYAIWEKIVEFFDAEIKKLGVKNTYFPMFVSQSALEREKSHIADFAPEVAWVTKSGDSDIAEPIAVRPTSETVMYPAYAKWIQSHRDLPLKLNQWCNVVRWEFKHPQPFLRTREFLWQEGHTAHASKEDAVEEVYQILDLYERIYTDLLAIPVIKGKKTEKEKFAGGDFTTTTEVYINASGRAIQGATSHHLGQNFSKMFEIVYEDPKTNNKEYVFQNSWGVTTRTIGVLTMVHGDNKGLVLPPRIACCQAMIIPCGITASLSEEDRDNLIKNCEALKSRLIESGIRCEGDFRENYSPGWKYNHWELKGVPIRIELGPRDVLQEQFVLVRRDTGGKQTAPLKEAPIHVKALLDVIQVALFNRAKVIQDEHVVVCETWNAFCTKLEMKCLILAPYCGVESCEDKIKKDSARDEPSEPGAPSMGAKALCIPFEQPRKLEQDTKCVHPKCTNKALFYTLFGRSY